MNRRAPGHIIARVLVPVALCIAPPGVQAQDVDGEEASDDVPVTLEAAELPSNVALRLDGLLEDEAWALATPITDFTQQEPVEGAAPSERTEIRVLFSKSELYIGVMLYDDPKGILAYQRRRDASLGTDDRFMWILDTFLDGRTGYFFEINAAGLMGDGLITGGGGGFGRGGFGGGGVNKSWDGIWEARAAVTPEGWSAEIRIPFQTLNFDPALETWGINFQRTIRRKNEEILWRGHRRNQGLRRPVHAGRLTGLGEISQGMGLEALPYVVSGWRTIPEDADATTYPRDLGVDLSYSITPSLRAAVSVNTDFAEVEVDQRRVNLTRFALRFQERRDFFLEGSGVFGFSTRNGVSPYFSRRIGLVEGEQIPINYGTRLGGQIGAFEVGFIQVGTAGVKRHGDEGGAEEDLESPAESFTIARVRRTIFEQSTIGAIYTRRSTDPNSGGFARDDRHTAGVDLNLSTSRFMGDKNLQLEAFLVWNSDAAPDVDPSFADLSARGFRFDFPNDIWQGQLSYREFGDEYNPQVGFVTRNGFRRVEPRIGWRPRPESIDWIRRFDFSLQFQRLSDIDSGVVEEREWRANLFGLDFESGDNFDVTLERKFEYLDESFEISDGIDILKGDYTNWKFSLRGRTAGRRRIRLEGEYSNSGFWSGDRKEYQIELTFRPNPGLSITGEYERNDVNLPQGSFNTNVMRLESGWDVSPWTSVTGNIQYDNDSEVVGLFLRGRWIVSPGNDVFMVYTQNWENLGTNVLDRNFRTLSRGGSLKFNYTYRF